VWQLVNDKLWAEGQLYGTFVPILESKEERLGQLEQRLQQARSDVMKLHSISSSSSSDDDVRAKEQSRPEADSEELNMSLSII
jgi:hypothetical protein